MSFEAFHALHHVEACQRALAARGRRAACRGGGRVCRYRYKLDVATESRSSSQRAAQRRRGGSDNRSGNTMMIKRYEVMKLTNNNMG
eukprot:6172210-Pleurochrysis_carterae.AAC.4